MKLHMEKAFSLEKKIASVMIGVVVSVISHAGELSESPLIGEETETNDGVTCFVAYSKWLI